MQIKISKPCKENWNEMSPTQQGAFCQKCAVDVIDFSNKSSEEVKQTLKTNIGKHMCGRFKKSQLVNLGKTYHNWENQSARIFQSKFLWACMIAFGFTLFTGCENSLAQSNSNAFYSNIQTELFVDDSSKVQTDSTHLTQVDSTRETPQYIEFIKGDIEYVEPPEEIEIMGEIAIAPDCTIEENEDTLNSAVIEKHPVIKMGKFITPKNFDAFLEDTTKIENVPDKIETDQITALVFPNPTTLDSKLNIEVTDEDYYDIELLTIDGKILSTIYSGFLDERERVFKIDLNDQPSGIYLVKITSSTTIQSLKVNKIR